jgi:lincosamide nucleotidyltransferase A/C/D/E
VATTEADAAEILGVLGAAEPRLAGGWGVDALAGRQTREHRDLDVMVPAHRDAHREQDRHDLAVLASQGEQP